jgi:hypothetical protein
MSTGLENVNHKYCEDALALEGVGRTVFFSLGKMLHKIREERLYEPYWDSWMSYCYEFKDLSPASISKLITVHEMFVLKYGYSPETLSETAGWTKLYQIAPHIHDKEQAEEWLEKAKTQTRQDLAKEITEAKTGVSMSECKHLKTFVIRVCEDCGDRELLY